MPGLLAQYIDIPEHIEKSPNARAVSDLRY